MEREGVAVVCLDIFNEANLMDPHLAGSLDSVVKSGKVGMWLAGPPRGRS